MNPLIRSFLLLQAGMIAGQVASTVVQTRLDPVGAEGPQGTLPIGGGLSRVDDMVMIGGSAGAIYTAAKVKMSGEGRVFLIGMALGFSSPVTQSIAGAIGQRITAAAA
jgi:hypothetical protein